MASKQQHDLQPTLTMDSTKPSTFERCRAINTKDIELTNYQGVRYISWASAWNRLKEHFPDARFVVHEFNEDGTTNKVPYLKTPLGTWVRVTVYLDGYEPNMLTSILGMTESLPVMDGAGKAVQNPDARDINDNIKRCLVKAMALHGFGLSVYEKDDLHAKQININSNNPVDSNTPRANKNSFVAAVAPAKGGDGRSVGIGLGEYRIPFGKFKDRYISEIPAFELISYAKWLQTEAKVKGKPLGAPALEFIEKVKALQTVPIQTQQNQAAEEPPPANDEDFGIPF